MHKNFAKYELVEEKEEDGVLYVVVGAGITFGENPNYNRSWRESLTGQLWDDGLALEDVGGTTHLTLGGFLSTGANGPGKEHTIQTQVIGLRFVNGLGEKVEVWRNGTHGDDADSVPPFDACLVNIGLLGVSMRLCSSPPLTIV